MHKPSANAHKPFAVFDISSCNIAGAHVLAGHTGTAVTTTFLAQARSNLSLQEDLNIERFIEEAVTHLGQVIAQIQKTDAHHPNYIQAVLASPWYSSQTRTIVYKKNAPFVCTQTLIDSLITKEIEHIIKNEEGMFGSFGNESVIVEKQLSLVKLNGYATSDPFGKKAQDMELFLTITIAPKVVIDRFSDVFHRAYGTRKIGFTTGAFTSYIVARDHLSVGTECMVVDVGEEVTDVAFIKDDFLLYQHSFPCGTYGLYRLLGEHADRTPHEAKALIESYRLQKLAPGPATAVEKAILSFTKEWQDGLQAILDNGQYGFTLPEHCYITADPRFESILVESIKTSPFIQHISAKGTLTPVFLNPALLSSAITVPVDTTPDMPLVIGALFVERLL